jgi:hypothetical protein
MWVFVAVLLQRCCGSLNILLGALELDSCRRYETFWKKEEKAGS